MFRDIIPIMENSVEKKMENDIGTGAYRGYSGGKGKANGN